MSASVRPGTAPQPRPSAVPSAVPTPGTPPKPSAEATVPPLPPTLEKVLASLVQMAEDPSLPRNIRRGAQGARETLTKNGQAIDVRVAGAVGLLDDLANDSNIPVHGRTAIWSLISQLESLQ